MERRRRTSLGRAVVTLSATGVAALVPIGSPAGATSDQPIRATGDDEQSIPPLDMVAETARIADELDLPTATVALHLQYREQIAALRAELATMPGFGGLWVERTANFKVIVAFVGTGAPAAIAAVGADYLPVQYLEPRQVDTPLAELEAALAGLVLQGASKAGVAGIKSSSFEAYIDEAANEVVLDVGSAAQAAQLKAALGTSSPVRVETVAALADPQDGCTRNACDPYSLAGLATLPLCSTGYTAKKNGVNGVITAKHCGAVSHHGMSLGTPSVQVLGGAVDAEWMALPAGWEDWIAIYAGLPENDFRSVRSVAAVDTDYVGMPVCASGGTTGYTCGTISSLNYSPGYIPSSYGFRLATYANADGDSGAPVFVGEQAQGIHVARRTADGQSIYGHVGNAITALGVEVNIK